MRRPVHRARLESWSSDELKAHLAKVVDELVAERDARSLREFGAPAISPLDVALDLFGGELEAFVLFGRVGHLDPPREDDKVPIVALRRLSEDPEIDVTIRETAKKWVVEQERRS